MKRTSKFEDYLREQATPPDGGPQKIPQQTTEISSGPVGAWPSQDFLPLAKVGEHRTAEDEWGDWIADDIGDIQFCRPGEPCTAGCPDPAAGCWLDSNGNVYVWHAIYVMIGGTWQQINMISIVINGVLHVWHNGGWMIADPSNNQLLPGVYYNLPNGPFYCETADGGWWTSAGPEGPWTNLYTGEVVPGVPGGWSFRFKLGHDQVGHDQAGTYTYPNIPDNNIITLNVGPSATDDIQVGIGVILPDPVDGQDAKIAEILFRFNWTQFAQWWFDRFGQWPPQSMWPMDGDGNYLWSVDKNGHGAWNYSALGDHFHH